MNIPSISNEPMVGKDGKLTDVWRLIINQLLAQLQGNVSNDGFNVPNRKSDDITALTSGNQNGSLLYDETNHKLMVKVNGAYKQIQTL